MLSKKLTTLLESFSGHHLNAFRRYLLSPYFNEKEELVQLYDQLDPLLRQSDTEGNSKAKQLKKKVVWKSLYGNRPYQDAKFRRLCSELTQHLFSFLSLQHHQEDPLHEITHALPQVNRPYLEKHFRGLLRQAERLEGKRGLRNGGYHYNRYLLNQQNHLFRERSGRKYSHLGELENADYHLDCFYITQKLKHYCDALGYRSFSAREARINLPPGFIESLEAGEFLREPSVKAYYLIARLLLYPEEKQYFLDTKDFLRAHGGAFPPRELNTLYIYLKNYCITTKVNAGDTEYYAELFDIFRTLLEEDILLEGDVLDPQDYKNIITVGLQEKAFDWVESFIQEFTAKLPPDHQENALTYNLAKVYFHQRKYGQVIEQLREVEYKNEVYALGGKLMLLKTYYELEEFLALDSLVDSFRIYLRRNRSISREVRQQYMNVLRFVKKLSRADAYDKAGIRKIEKQIRECKALAAKGWLLEKAGALQR